MNNIIVRFVGASILLAASAQAEYKFPELPSTYPLHDKDNASNTGQESLKIDCHLVFEPGNTGTIIQDEADCIFRQVHINKPSEKTISDKLSELESLSAQPGFFNDLKKETSKSCPEILSKFPDGLQDIEATAANLFKHACVTKSPEDLLNAIKFNIREVEANTCTALMNIGEAIRFKQRDANTWRAVEETAFGNTIVWTIWRQDSKDPWGLRKVSTGIGGPNCDQSKIGCVPSSTYNWIWYPRQPTMNCPIMDLNP